MAITGTTMPEKMYDKAAAQMLIKLPKDTQIPAFTIGK